MGMSPVTWVCPGSLLLIQVSGLLEIICSVVHRVLLILLLTSYKEMDSNGQKFAFLCLAQFLWLV